MDIDLLFILLLSGCAALAIYSAYKIGRIRGRKEYYEALTSKHQEDIL
jgi:hypothetical protein